MNKRINFSILIGKILKVLTINNDDDEIIFETIDNEKYKLFHDQDCCETVTIEDICGNLDDLIGSPLLIADERTNEHSDYDSSFTWTFYEIATIKGSVTIRWYGESNGYYSEKVDFIKLNR